MKVIDWKSTQPPLTKRAKLFQNKLQVPALKNSQNPNLFNKYTKFRIEYDKQNKHLFYLIANKSPALTGPDKKE